VQYRHIAAAEHGDGEQDRDQRLFDYLAHRCNKPGYPLSVKCT
jgi:hypothetical protein